MGEIDGRVTGLIGWSELPPSQPYDGVQARRFDTEHATVVRYELEPGARYPLHDHPEEQLVQVLTGSIELELGASRLLLVAGDLAHVPGGVRHGARCPGPQGAVFLNIVIPRRRP
jgi:quercetin dioxygenase-like cupin family protein